MLVLIGCGANVNENKKPNESVTNGAEDLTDGLNEYGDKLPDNLNYDGYEFRVLMHTGGNLTDTSWRTYVEIPEMNGDVLNDGAYERNLEVEARLNVTIKARETGSWDKISAELAKTVLANSDEYDYAVIGPNDNAAVLLSQNIVVDFKTMDYIDLDAPYYFHNASETFTIAGKQFLLAGEYMCSMISSVSLLFNKTLSESLNLPSFYDVVDKGNWTFDYMMNCMKDVYSDANGDGKVNYGDIFGMTTHPVMGIYLYSSFGGTTVRIDKDGKFEMAVYNERNVQFIDKLLQLYNSADVFVDPGKPWESFFDGNALFCYYGSSLTRLRPIDSFDFGYLPTPKYDEKQERYYNYLCGALTAVPITVSDVERTGAIIEAIYSASHRILVPAYIASYVEQKIMRDEGSQRMYRLTLAEGIYDITGNVDPSGKIQNYKLISELFNKKSNDLASSWAAVEIAVTEAYNNLYDEIVASIN